MDELNMKKPMMGMTQPELPPHHVSKPLKVLLGVFAVVLLGTLGYFVWFENQQALDTDEPKPSTASGDTASGQKTTDAQKRAGQIVITAISQADTLEYNYFNTQTHSFVEKTTNNQGSDKVSGGGSIYDTCKIQFSSDGSSHYFSSLEGGMEAADPKTLYSAVYRSPGTLVYKTTGDKGLFDRWLITKDGKYLYVAKAATQDSEQYELLKVNTTTSGATKVADLESYHGRIWMNSDETKIITGTSKERVEDGFHYRDVYIKTVTLSDGGVKEALIWKGEKNGNLDYDGLKIGPKLLKGISDFTADRRTKVTMRTINLSDNQVEDIYTLGGGGQAHQILWSSDGMKVVFVVEGYGSPMPTDQGIVLYDFSTEKATQILRTDYAYVNDTYTGYARVVPGLFDSKGFAYTETSGSTNQAQNGTLYYYDLAGKTSYKVAENIGGAVSAYRY